MAPAIKSKVHQLPGVEHLYAVMTRDQLEIPAYITEYDMAVRVHLFSSIFRHFIFFSLQNFCVYIEKKLNFCVQIKFLDQKDWVFQRFNK